jgi:hypothetical protein
MTEVRSEELNNSSTPSALNASSLLLTRGVPSLLLTGVPSLLLTTRRLPLR